MNLIILPLDESKSNAWKLQSQKQVTSAIIFYKLVFINA